VGYRYINIDDFWAKGRDVNGILLASDAFPSGMKALGDYIHSKGLLFGLYTDVGTNTCDGQRQVHMSMNVKMPIAEWGVDWLKEDHCALPKLKNESSDEFYLSALTKMSRCLNSTGRGVYFDLCAHGCFGSLHNPSCWDKWYTNTMQIGNS